MSYGSSLLGMLSKMATAVGPVGLPYRLDEKPVVSGPEAGGVWSGVFQASRKDDGSPVTVFHCPAAAIASSPLAPCIPNAAKRLKTLRHPNVLKFIDYVEDSSGAYLVTERVTPLTLELQRDTTRENKNGNGSEQQAWGLYCVANALAFINAKANLVHGNVRLSSVFVTSAGEWKLGGMELVSGASDPAGLLASFGGRMLDAVRYEAPECKTSVGWAAASSAAIDAWMYACLICGVYNQGDFLRAEQLHAATNIPVPLISHYRRLLNANPSSRLSIEDFLRIASTPGQIFDTPLINTAQFLEQIALKDDADKIQFFKSLPSVLDRFPAAFSKYKILPVLSNALEFGSAGPRILPMVLDIGHSHLDDKEYGETIIPLVIRLFSSPDRGIRMRLLESASSFINKMSATVVNEKLYPQMSLGFTDPDPALREATVKATARIVPLLSERTLNNDLLRQLAKTQVDPEPGIRANTIICLGMVAPHLSEGTRKKVLMTAFARSLRDPFPPARSATIMALLATADYYDAEEMAVKMIPSIVGLMVDPDKQVRVNASKCVYAYLKRVEAHAANMPDLAAQQAEMEATAKDAESSQPNAPIPSTTWGGWAAETLSKTVIGTTATQVPIAASSTSASQSVGPTQIAYKNDDGWEGLDVIMSTAAPIMRPTTTAAAPSSGMNLGHGSSARRGSEKLADQLVAFETKAGGWGADSGWADLESATSSIAKTVSSQSATSNADMQRKKEERRARMEQLKQQRRAAGQ